LLEAAEALHVITDHHRVQVTAAKEAEVSEAARPEEHNRVQLVPTELAEAEAAPDQILTPVLAATESLLLDIVHKD
jgi:hypothetical protein